MTGARAWAALATLITVYELACPDGQLLSEAVDRAIERHPALTTAGIAAVALHLANALPDRVDPIHQFARLARKATR